MVYLKSLVASMLHLSWTNVPAALITLQNFQMQSLLVDYFFRASLVREVCSMKNYACMHIHVRIYAYCRRV